MPSTGTCSLCGAAVSKRTAGRHLDACAPAHDGSSGEKGPVLRFRVTPAAGGPWWLDVEARGTAALTALDNLLRAVWLECCGHLSQFEVGSYRYVSDAGPNPFEPDPDERTMAAKIGDVFRRVGTKARYEYDFGSTTMLALELTGVRDGRLGREAARLLARNDPPVWSCGECEEPATAICALHESDSSPFVCKKHQKNHPCGDEVFLPVVNSPRMGVCAYEG